MPIRQIALILPNVLQFLYKIVELKVSLYRVGAKIERLQLLYCKLGGDKVKRTFEAERGDVESNFRHDGVFIAIVSTDTIQWSGKVKIEQPTVYHQLKIYQTKI